MPAGFVGFTLTFAVSHFLPPVRLWESSASESTVTLFLSAVVATLTAVVVASLLSRNLRRENQRMRGAINNMAQGGGWVATHEDTERRDAERERVSMQRQQERRAAIEAAIATFRRRVEDHLRTVTEGARAMRSTAATLFGNSGQTSTSADGAVSASNEASTNVETAAVAAATSWPVRSAKSAVSSPIRRTSCGRPWPKRMAQITRSRRWRRLRKRSATSSYSFVPSQGRPICLPSMRQSKPRVRARPAKTLRL